MPGRGIRSATRQALIRQSKTLRKELSEALHETGDELKKMHQDAVRDWKHRPKFKLTYALEKDRMSVEIRPAGQHKRIYRFVDAGTRGPYIIRPKKPGGRLRFQTGYDAKTMPIAKGHVGTGGYSGEWVSASQVVHPGIEAREFSKTFTEDIRPQFIQAIENAFRRALRRK